MTLFEKATVYAIVGIAIFLSSIMVAHASESITSTDWTGFVIHIRQGAVDGPVVGGKCTTATGGCARRKPAVQGAWLDGECWITIRPWVGPIVLENWGHELAHCVGKSHDEEGIWIP